MVRLTLIARQRDGLPLAEGLDNDKDPDLNTYKQQAKTLFKKLSANRSSQQSERLSVESGRFAFHTLNRNDVCFLTLAEKEYPKKLAFQYLDELASEFNRLYGPQIETVTRPYAFIKFDTFVQKTKKLYLDTRTQRNLTKLTQDVGEVTQIMTKNIQEILGQGEKMNVMSDMSRQLIEESDKYKKGAQELYHSALLRKYIPWLVLAGILLLVFVFRYMYR